MMCGIVNSSTGYFRGGAPRGPRGQPIGSHFVQAANMAARRQSSGVRVPEQIGQGTGVKGLRSEGGRIYCLLKFSLPLMRSDEKRGVKIKQTLNFEHKYNIVHLCQSQ
jgi:hypothetical protein